MRMIIAFGTLFFFSCLTGCGGSVKGVSSTSTPNSPLPTTPEVSESRGDDKSKDSRSELEINRTKWGKSGIKNYQMTVSMIHGALNSPAEPVSITVRDGKTVSIIPVVESDKRDIEQYSGYVTVEKMFDTIQMEIDRGVLVRVKYNEHLGFPQEISLDYANRGTFLWRSVSVEMVK